MSLKYKVTDESEILNNEENNIYAESMNKYHKNNNLINHPKLLIVGTLTPPQGKGYHYTSNRNKMYKYLDCGLRNENDRSLEQLKNRLQEYQIARESNDTSSYRKGMHGDDEILKLIKEIETNLEKKRILILDVVDKALRKDANSSSDDNIIECTLDYKSFEKINGAEYVIVNSKNAYECFCKIMNKVGKNNFPNIICLPQNPRGFIRLNRIGYEENRYEEIWGSVIKYCLNGEKLPNRFENLCVVKKDDIVKREEWPPFGARIINNVA